MTFSEKVKIELSMIEAKKSCCLKAQAYGIALFGKNFTADSINLHTTNKTVADSYANLLVSLTDCIVNVTEIERDSTHDKSLFLVEVEEENDRNQVLRYFDQKGDHINHSNLPDECCRRAFLRGCLMACCNITDPNKEYHMEFVVNSTELCQDLLDLLFEFGIHAKQISRKGSEVLYIKESENIEDLLTLTGAVKSSLELMDIKILKNVRNKVNRVTNCETANIEKTVVASTSQIRDIQWIIEHKGLSYLPDELQEIAKLRLEYPELSLSELCGISKTKLSRSGMNHRLKKISQIAADLRLNSCKAN